MGYNYYADIIETHNPRDMPVCRQLQRAGLPYNDRSGLSLLTKQEWRQIGASVCAASPRVDSLCSFYQTLLGPHEDNHSYRFAWLERGKPVGLCSVKVGPQDPLALAWVDWFFVLPERRGSRVAYRMSYALLIWLRLKGLRRASLVVPHGPTFGAANLMIRKMGCREVLRLGKTIGDEQAAVLFTGDIEVLSRRVTRGWKTLLPIFVDDTFGLYCDYTIRKGEAILHLKGPYLSAPTFRSIQVGSGRHIEDEIGMYINHHANPNSVVTPEATIVATRDIEAGTEITVDYTCMNERLVRPFTRRCLSLHRVARG
jgi:hypothetical protein